MWEFRCKHQEILESVLVAVGRVKVYQGLPMPGLHALPELVASVVSDHDEIEDRVTDVVDYIRDLPEAVRTMPEIQRIGRILQGDDPQIVDLQG
jgi:hypothetical protein